MDATSIELMAERLALAGESFAERAWALGRASDEREEIARAWQESMEGLGQIERFCAFFIAHEALASAARASLEAEGPKLRAGEDPLARWSRVAQHLPLPESGVGVMFLLGLERQAQALALGSQEEGADLTPEQQEREIERLALGGLLAFVAPEALDELSEPTDSQLFELLCRELVARSSSVAWKRGIRLGASPRASSRQGALARMTEEFCADESVCGCDPARWEYFFSLATSQALSYRPQSAMALRADRPEQASHEPMELAMSGLWDKALSRLAALLGSGGAEASAWVAHEAQAYARGAMVSCDGLEADRLAVQGLHAKAVAEGLMPDPEPIRSKHEHGGALSACESEGVSVAFWVSGQRIDAPLRSQARALGWLLAPMEFLRALDAMADERPDLGLGSVSERQRLDWARWVHGRVERMVGIGNQQEGARELLLAARASIDAWQLEKATRSGDAAQRRARTRL